MIAKHTAEADVAPQFSIFRGWCSLLLALLLAAVGQQWINTLTRTFWASPAITTQDPSTYRARFVVDVNRAPADELAALPEVGAALAARIVDYRQLQGPFKNIEELLHVRGVGERTLQQLRPMLAATAP